ncbi:ABC transporter transmembrane domain-containing protein [Vibrio mediterranei]|uniref:ABC transporter transmembrane domain-containing protein n=1 Tax=Vibrio mediterranei TaxID=689 RepID=UPI00148C684C|nr:ABC transporter transmembrane domain-containing protein [Vibrio mediterranei]NOH28830.1 ATP-binding cassette domain-containing protein [Vibrio mediterranei]
MDTAYFSQKISWMDKLYLTFSTIMSTLFALVLPFSILIIFDRVLPNQATDTLFALFAIILVAIYLDYLLRMQEEVITASLMKSFEQRLTNKVFRAVCLAQIPEFSRLESGQYLERIAAIPELKNFFGGEVVRALINSAVSVITMVVITIINLWAGIALFVASLVLAIAAFRISNRKVSAQQTKSEIEGLTNSKIIEIVSSPLDNKSRTMEYRLESLMTDMIKTREKKSIEYENLESHFNLILTLIQQLSIAVVVVLLAISVINLEATQGVMAAIIMLTNRYFSPYQQVMRTIGRWKLNRVQIIEISEILALEHFEKSHEVHAINSFDDITIQLDEKQRIIINRGEPILLQGPSGSGKSHLTRSLTCDNECGDTVIRIGDLLLSELPYHSWREQVHRIDRNSGFVEGSIIDNLTCFRPMLNGAAFTLCKGLAVKNEIDALEQGFYTQLKGNKTIPLSRQVQYALLIIRAMLSQKKLVILDDIDTVFDPDFAQRVVSMLVPKSSGQFLIIVSNKIRPESYGLKSIKLSKERAHL